MSLFNLSDIEQDIAAYTSQSPDIETLRREVSLDQIVAFYGMPITRQRKTICLWHNDHHPSLHLYPNGGYCFVCQRHVSIFDYVMQKERCSFPEAVQWIVTHLPGLSQRVVTATSLPYTSDYKGPVPLEWISYWQAQMTCVQFEKLLKERQLFPSTVRNMGIGWRPDLAAYVIPYWRGKPRDSAVDIVQYRSTEDTPFDGTPWRYKGHRGYNRPSVLNTDLINPFLVVVVFGTFDAILARQDGIPAISPNTISAFSDPKRPETKALQQRLQATEKIFVVPDRTPQEHESARRLAEFLGGEIRFFHLGIEMDGKDYCDYRRNHSPQHFIKEVLGMDPDKVRETLAVVFNNENADVICDIFDHIANGRGEVAKTLLEIVEQGQLLPLNRVCWGLNMLMGASSDGVFAPDEQEQFSREVTSTQSFENLKDLVARWSEKAILNRGGF